MLFKYKTRIFTPTNERLSPYIVAQASPRLVHFPGEKQDAVFLETTGELVAGPYGEGYRVKLFYDENGHPAACCFHWYNGPNEHYSLLAPNR